MKKNNKIVCIRPTRPLTCVWVRSENSRAPLTALWIELEDPADTSEANVGEVVEELQCA